MFTPESLSGDNGSPSSTDSGYGEPVRFAGRIESIYHERVRCQMIGKRSMLAGLTGLSLLLTGMSAFGQSGRPVKPYSSQSEALAAEGRRLKQEGQRLTQVQNRYQQMQQTLNAKVASLNQRIAAHNRNKPSGRDRAAVARFNEEAQRLNSEKATLQQETQRLAQYRSGIEADVRRYQEAVQAFNARAEAVRRPGSGPSNQGGGFSYDEKAKVKKESDPRPNPPSQRPSNPANPKPTPSNPSGNSGLPLNRPERDPSVRGNQGKGSGSALPNPSLSRGSLTLPPSRNSSNRPDLAVPGSPPLSDPIRNPVQGSNGVLNPANPAVGQGDGRFGAPRAGGRSHRGIDIPAAVGTPVHPVKDGTVIFSGPGSRAEGYKVKVRHADGSVSVYMHLDGQRMPQIGQRVDVNTVIGAVGRTGNVPPDAQPHLHLQVYGPDGDVVVPNLIEVTPLPLS